MEADGGGVFVVGGGWRVGGHARIINKWRAVDKMKIVFQRGVGLWSAPAFAD